MRILHAVESLLGGPASYFNETIPHQIALYGAPNVALVVPEAHLDALSAEVKTARIYPVDRQGRSVKSLLNFSSAFGAGVKEFAPAIVHLHSTFAGAIGRSRLALSGYGGKVVYCAHGWAFDIEGEKKSAAKQGAIVLTERLLAHVTDRIVNISEADQRSASRSKVGRGRSLVIHNGVAEIAQPAGSKAALQAQLGMDAVKTNILFVGRFDRQKGIDLAVEAMRQLSSSQFHLYAVGDVVVSKGGRPMQDVAADIGSVSLLGWKKRDELPPYFAAADVVVMPSRWEGFGLVAIEAMRVGTPVLATNVGALPELIEDRVSGRLAMDVTPEAIAGVLSDETKQSWAAYGHKARERFLTRFTAQRMNDALTTLYRTILETPAGR